MFLFRHASSHASQLQRRRAFINNLSSFTELSKTSVCLPLSHYFRHQASYLSRTYHSFPASFDKSPLAYRLHTAIDEDEESFPNAEVAFRDAFTQPDPAAKLLELIKAHPSGEAITDLVSVYFQLAAEDPTQLPRYAEALTIIQTTQETTIIAEDEIGDLVARNIAPVLDRTLAEFHGGDLVPRDASIVPSNDYLVASLLSAVSLRYRFTDCSAQVGAISHGLHYKNDYYFDIPATLREVIVLGSCLQLLVAGSYLYGPGGTDVGKDDISAALEAVKADRVVKTPNGQQLLEDTIQHAKSGFVTDWTVENAWRALFSPAI